MVRQVLGFVYKEITGLHQAAYVLALFAFGSQLLALVRDRLLASEFGAGAVLDVYYTAFRVPDLLFVLFASALSVYVLLPFVSERVAHRSSKAAAALLSQIMTLFILVYLIIVVGVWVAAPHLSGWLFPNIADQAALVHTMRILLLQPLLLGLSSLFGVVTQYQNRFVLHALSPLLYNAGIILGIVFLYPWLGIAGLAWGVVLGAAGHWLMQWPLVQRSPLRIQLTTTFDIAALYQVIITAIPRAITLSLNQVTLLILFSLGSAMATGSVAVFQFAFNLQSVPLAIIGVSYSVAAFPTLAKLYAQAERAAFVDHIIVALRHIIFWSVPVIALCVVLRAQLVRVILGAGAFNWEDTRLTAATFAILIISLVAHGIHLLLVRALYAGGDTRTPLIIAIIGMLTSVTIAWSAYTLYLANTALQYVVASTLRVSDVAGTEVLALAAGYTFGMLLQATLMLLVTQYRFNLRWAEPLRVTGHALLAAIAGGGAAYISLNFFVQGLNVDTFIGIFLQGALGALCGLVAVIGTYALVRSPELHEVSASLTRKIFKTDVVASQKHVL